MGFLAMILAGSRQRAREAFGWACAIASEGAFCAWAALDHVYGAFPWVVLWTAVYAWNYCKWRKP